MNALAVCSATEDYRRQRTVQWRGSAKWPSPSWANVSPPARLEDYQAPRLPLGIPALDAVASVLLHRPTGRCVALMNGNREPAAPSKGYCGSGKTFATALLLGLSAGSGGRLRLSASPWRLVCSDLAYFLELGGRLVLVPAAGEVVLWAWDQARLVGRLTGATDDESKLRFVRDLPARCAGFGPGAFLAAGPGPYRITDVVALDEAAGDGNGLRLHSVRGLLRRQAVLLGCLCSGLRLASGNWRRPPGPHLSLARALVAGITRWPRICWLSGGAGLPPCERAVLVAGLIEQVVADASRAPRPC